MNRINAVSKVISQEIAREFPLESTEPLYEVADIFQRYGAVYRSKHRLIPQQYRAMRAIERCRTTALGAHVDACDHCAHIEISYNSCRNRHCPKCRGRQRQAWVDARELEVLPIQYFHLVFTLPQTLITLARNNPEHIYTLLLQSAAQTLQSFANKRWDASLGITLVLHIWGQTLNEHPHVHCIVTGGALRNDGCRFIRAPKNFLFPVKALSLVYRAKFLAGLETARTQTRGTADIRTTGIGKRIWLGGTARSALSIPLGGVCKTSLCRTPAPDSLSGTLRQSCCHCQSPY